MKLEERCTFADECMRSNYGTFSICYRDYISCTHYQKMMEQKLKELDLCPFTDKCATEYGDADVCKDENYKECVIYRELKKYKEKI